MERSIWLLWSSQLSVSMNFFNFYFQNDLVMFVLSDLRRKITTWTGIQTKFFSLRSDNVSFPRQKLQEYLCISFYCRRLFKLASFLCKPTKGICYYLRYYNNRYRRNRNSRFNGRETVIRPFLNWVNFIFGNFVSFESTLVVNGFPMMKLKGQGNFETLVRKPVISEA